MICSNCESTEFTCGGCGVNLQPEDEGCTGEGRGRGHTLTASEVKVLTETATRVAYALGRKDAGEEIAAAADEIAESHADAARKHRAVGSDEYETIARIHRAQASGAWEVAREARDIASRVPGAASDATSGVTGHQEVSEAVRSPQEPGEGS